MQDVGPGNGFGTILEARTSVVEWLSEEHAVVSLVKEDSLEPAGRSGSSRSTSASSSTSRTR